MFFFPKNHEQAHNVWAGALWFKNNDQFFPGIRSYSRNKNLEQQISKTKIGKKKSRKKYVDKKISTKKMSAT